MSTPKHTPGPWRLQVNRVKDYVSVFPIQVCIEESPLSDETIANATLITAAPAMYEALKAMLELIGDDDLPDNGELSGAAICALSRSALAQAEGKL